MAENRWKALLALAAVAGGLALAFLLSRMGPATTQKPAGPEPDPRESYRRVVCMSPAVTEIAFAIGAGERVVGVSQHTRYPPEALKKPKCGGFFNPSYERILSLDPDLIVVQGEAADLTRFADANEIDLAVLELTDLPSIVRQMRELGDLLGLAAQAEAAAGELERRLGEIRRKAADRQPVDVLLVTGREQEALRSIHTVGPGTFLHDVIEITGARNVFDDLPVNYGVVNKEALLERAPEVIVELKGEGGDRTEVRRRVRRAWDGMPSLPAVKNGRVYAVAATYAMIPGPRVAKLAERLFELFHLQPGAGERS